MQQEEVEVAEETTETSPHHEVPPDDEEEQQEAPPPRRRIKSNANLYTLLGLGFALIAAGAYFFLFLRPARQRALQEVARFSAIEGDVKVKPNVDQKWKAAKVAMILAGGDVVQTEPQAGAELTFKTGNLVRLRPDSVVLIGEEVDSSETTWRVQEGEVNFELTKNTQIATPTATTRTTGGSEGQISVLEGGQTGIKIFKGTAQVATSAGEQIVLKENEAVKVDAKGKASKKSVLPPPPTPTFPLPASQLSYVKAPGTITRLEWRPVEGGATYRVALDYNVQQANLLLSAALDAPGLAEAAHNLKGLEPGKYFWRVAGVNEDGEEGKFSKVTTFTVVPPSEAAPVAAATTDPSVKLEPFEVMGGVLALRGRAAPGSTVAVDGVEIGVRPDGSFSEFLRKGDRSELTIKITGPGGEVTEEKRPVS
jgi:hypothetical protein